MPHSVSVEYTISHQCGGELPVKMSVDLRGYESACDDGVLFSYLWEDVEANLLEEVSAFMSPEQKKQAIAAIKAALAAKQEASA